MLFYHYEDLIGRDRELHVALISQFVLGDPGTEDAVRHARQALAHVASCAGTRPLSWRLAGLSLGGGPRRPSRNQNQVPHPCGEAFVHPPTCASRVDDWPALREKLAGTYAREACDKVDAFLAACR